MINIFQFYKDQERKVLSIFLIGFLLSDSRKDKMWKELYHFSQVNSLDVVNIVFYLNLSACVLCCFSRIQLCVTLWTVAHQCPLSRGFSRQEYWSGSHVLLPGIFLTQGSNFCLLASPELARKFFTTNTTWETLT